ncbi:23S rRNA (pseudouridine(1915)-N(3))-methyltransferase RlmH [Marinicella gelatinilytica]|uniref:23S rRNA (pseudouridine(1915)-N(3))-methyltransferase RlmH n=1 Tax=Marinicella gelatinilytica TaxID=2996017 RepID=UPI0022609660|nr:23S rRNA (pseudouridine(1915)-N(3))-methyltransferase RlmH [Marinicella gelatinilytica]MCX7544007.1 23S rRNA (pseudouridine(1915)-N(3))-methyltransferase RlmH [Marinicella gelatinilytica]
MRIHLLTPGHKMPDWVETAFTIYNQRLPQHLCLQHVPITTQIRRKNQSVSNIKLLEADAILAHLKPGQINIAFDERGKKVDTLFVSQQLADWQMTGSDVNLIVGGADGLHQKISNQAHQKWSLSALTFPHQLVKVIIVEQIYRAYSLLNNHPYHRE